MNIIKNSMYINLWLRYNKSIIFNTNIKTQLKRISLYGFTGELYWISKEEITSSLQISHWVRKGEDIFQLILWDQHYPNTKTRQRQHKK